MLIAYNGLVFGVWSFDHGYYEYGGLQAATPAAVMTALVAAVLSPTRGLLVMYPGLLVAATGLASAWRHAPAVVRASALAGVAALLTQLLLNPIEGEGFFGTRLTIEPLTFAYPLLVMAWQRRSPSIPSWFAALTLSYSAALHTAGAVMAPRLLVPGGVTTLSVTAVAVAAMTASIVAAMAARLWPLPPPRQAAEADGQRAPVSRAGPPPPPASST
jgi:hypothetical protein